MGNLSSRRGAREREREINVSIGNQHLYLPAWHLAKARTGGKRVAINEAHSVYKKKAPTIAPNNLRSNYLCKYLCVMRVLLPLSAIRSGAEQVLCSHCIPTQSENV